MEHGLDFFIYSMMEMLLHSQILLGSREAYFYLVSVFPVIRRLGRKQAVRQKGYQETYNRSSLRNRN